MDVSAELPRRGPAACTARGAAPARWTGPEGDGAGLPGAHDYSRAASGAPGRLGRAPAPFGLVEPSIWEQPPLAGRAQNNNRQEDRRVGKECVSTVRSWGSPDQ